ncbi:MAG: type 2 isopentenyl-diphosphate Delta-isomerase [Bdellovibrionales bacterium]|nr:type 2 isopentenyl-diphosphate Delta-isomerase [Bdellovibrionales bacterium]
MVQDPGGTSGFESRKKDHIELSLNNLNQTTGLSGLDRISLVHEALPEMDFSEVDLSADLLGRTLRTPLFVSSMTAGHAGGLQINEVLAEACSSRGWLMGVGSQRRELFDPAASSEWKKIRGKFPKTHFIGNIGLVQLIQISTDQVLKLIENLGAVGLFVHLNALQECLQPEGAAHFRGGLKTIEELARVSPVPIIVKETGCGFSESTLARLWGTGVHAVDVSGLGGTHWGRIEGMRSPVNSELGRAAETLQDWGHSTLESLLAARKLTAREGDHVRVWASGGIRTGLDAAKCLALGAEAVGFAKPALEHAVQGVESLERWMKQMETELSISLFCTGSKSPKDIKVRDAWKKI